MLLLKFFCIFVVLYLKILNITCEGSSLAFAIDNTRSMGKFLDEVKNVAIAIMKTVIAEKTSEIQNFVLITLNDPDITIASKTSSSRTFRSDINRIHIYNNFQNNECEENSLSGVEKAMKTSGTGSYIFLFTDAYAKDYAKVNKIKYLCQKKHNQVIFVLTGDCGHPSDRRYTVYYDIAAACSGQVFRVTRGYIGTVVEPINMFLKRKHSIVKWIKKPRSDAYTNVSFNIDYNIDYALVSVTGVKAKLRISSIDHMYGPGPESQIIMRNDYGKFIKVYNLTPGTYYARVKGKSITSLMVYAPMEFTFNYGFATIKPRSMQDTFKQPTAGRRYHLFIDVIDPDQSVNVKSVQILDMQQDVKMELPLSNILNNFYLTDDFVSPNYVFKIKLIGEIRKTSQPITKISTTIAPEIVVTVPDVHIDEGDKQDVHYGARVSLTCMVNAYPPPKIEWLNADGTSLLFQSFQTIEEQYIVNLALKFIKNNETFVCQATNTEGTGTKQTLVAIQPLFNAFTVPAAHTHAKYGEHLKIPCNVKSYLPIQIKWFLSGRELSSTDKHTISADGSELTLQSMDLGMQGQYTCEASLISDPTEKQTYETEVTIPGLTRPLIESKYRKIYVKKNENEAELSCKTTRGYPKPRVQWFKKNGNDFELISHATSEVLTVARALFTPAGQYKCVAENDLGSDSAEFVVIPESEPDVTIEEGAYLYVNYGARVSLTCRVSAHPPPKIRWFRISGSSLPYETIKTVEPSYISYLNLQNVKRNETFVCKSTNTEGSTTKQIQVDVRAVFNVLAVPAANTIAKFDEDVKLQCSIKSYLPIQIKWFRSGKELRNTDKHSISTDGSQLTLQSMDLGMQGQYTCEASLISDPTEKQTYETEVTIPGLTRPVIESKHRKIYVKKNENEAELSCKTSRGYPKPRVQWFKKNGNDLELISHATSEVLIVARALFTPAGQYKCVAENALGSDSAEFVVIPENKPVIIDKGGNLNVTYGADVSLTCKVTAHPRPTIEWFTLGGIPLEFEMTAINETTFKSYLTLKNIKQNEIYVCKATNTEGTTTNRYQVDVQPVFTPGVFTAANTTAEYGKDVNIQCNIKSYLPIQIKWFRSGKELRNTDKHSISADGSELTLQSMDLGMQGRYTCEASLISDPTEKQTYETEVTIPGLTRPVIESKHRKIYVKKNENEAELSCKTSRGYPKPRVQWFKKNGNDLELISHATSEVLTVARALFTPAGQYKCVAENALGSDSAEFVVIPENKPVIIDKGGNLNVTYGADVTLTCKVTAHPRPTIEWFTLGGIPLEFEMTAINETTFKSYLTLKNIKQNEIYVCKATNTEGTTTNRYQVDVQPVFTPGVFTAANTTAEYGKDVNIQCNIKSYLPIQIKWFRSGKELRNTDKHSISADGSELTLQSMDLGMQGRYTCEASLISDPTEKQTYETEVTIPGLTRPVIESKHRKIYVKKNENEAELSCKTSRGYPKPRVQWFKKNGNDLELISHATSEVLTVARALFTPAGQYKCVAENALGSDSAEFVVIPENKPVIIDKGGNLNVTYGADVSLTCKVTAHPRPTIEWFTVGGIPLEFEMTAINETTFKSYLTLKNIKQNEIYICKATNTEGTTTNRYQVDVQPVFTPGVAVPAANTTAEYGKGVQIQCNIKSYLPIKIKWFRSGKELRNTDKHSISADGSELTLQSMDLGMQGRYTCEASLIYDPTEKQTYETEVLIPGLTGPVIESNYRKTYVKKEDQKTEISCKTTRGYPKPRVQWFKKNSNDFELISHATSEVLTVARALFTPAGQYKCVAENDLGSDSAEFVVIPEGEPDVHIVEGVNLNVNYGAEISLTCNVAAHPRPAIEWLLAGGIVSQPFETTLIEEPLYTSKLQLKNINTNETYVCKATNTEGTSTTQIHVDVRPVFNAIAVPTAITSATYNGDVKIQCIIKSYLPIQIKWFRSGRELSNTYKHTISADGSELTLKSMGLAMQGKYTCEASLISDPTAKQTHNTDVQIAGLVYPEVTCTDSSTVLSGNNFTAICRVKGVPKPTVSWHFKPKNSEEFSKLPGSEEELNIPEVKLHHFGVYKCTAKNVLGQTKREFNIVVEERPTITNEVNTYFGVEGDLVLPIPCNVTGFPDPSIVWKEGDKTIGNDSNYVVTENVLYIKNPEVSDTRTITCVATNKLGTAITTFNTEVTDIFANDENFYGETHEVSVENGKPITITCALVNSLTDSVRWYRNGYKTSLTGSTYVIEKANVLDDGNYTCRMNTIYGSQSETSVLDVGMAPGFRNVHPELFITEWKYADQKLDCTADSKPQSKIEWSHHGIKLDSFDNLYEITITDWGEYTCRVSNVHGSINRTFKVTSSGCYLRNIALTPNMPLITDLSAIDMQISINNVDLILTQDDEIKFLCPNDTKISNAFQIFSSKAEITAKCDNEDKFIVNGKKYRYKDFQCDRPVESSVLHTSKQCFGPQSETMRVGFAGNDFLEAFQVCYDTNKNVPLYASGSIHFMQSGIEVDPSVFQWNPAPGLGDGKPTGGFTCGASNKCCYSKGQLLNVNELPFGPAQTASFVDNLNSISIWNPCSDSNRTSWQYFDSYLRDTSSTYEIWFSWTGASDYVSKNNGFVPRYLWKLMIYDDSASAMVYVNDESPVDSDIKCSENCKSMMGFPDKLQPVDKFLYCCTVSEFSKVFGVPLDDFKLGESN